jgi:hypothetical protein
MRTLEVEVGEEEDEVRRRRAEEVGVGVEERWTETSAEFETRSEKLVTEEEGGWSVVLGRWRHELKPRASLSFRHLFSIFLFFLVEKRKEKEKKSEVVMLLCMGCKL